MAPGLALLGCLSACASMVAERKPSASPELAGSGFSQASVNPALEALWSSRRTNSKDFAIGAGDVLEIQVPGVKDLEDRTVRVDGKGNIDLPLLGAMHVAGLSEPELDSALVKKLGDYLYHPQAQIFVKSYNNRQVSVSGEVRTPADYTLNGPGDTVRELIQRAGGVTQQAGVEIMFIPGASNFSELMPAEAEGDYSAASYNGRSEISAPDPLEGK